MNDKVYSSLVSTIMPMPDQFRRFLPLLMVIIAGTGLSTLAYLGARRLEQKTIQAEFRLASENRASAIKREMDTNLAALSLLRGYSELSPQLTQKAFEQFSARTLAVYPGIRALEWIPRITAAQRPAFENQLRQDQAPRAEITEGNSTNPSRAGNRAEYYPVQYLYPPNSDARAITGFDVSMSPSFAKAMERARESGQPMAADRIRLLERTADRFGIPVLLPVFRPYAGGFKDDGDELIGFVMGIFQLADILERALKYVEPRGVNIQVLDDSAAPDRRALYFHQSPVARRPQKPLDERNLAATEGMVYRTTTETAGRQWRIVCTPSEEFAEGLVSWKPWGILVVGIVVTLAVAVYFLLNYLHNTRTDRLVEELSRANSQLNTEIGERIRAEEHLAIARDQALEASRLKTQFLANTSHEIRTPMNGIIGMADLLMATPLNSEQREYAETMEHSSHALLRIIDDILDFSKIEAGKLEMQQMPFRLKSMMNHVMAIMGEQAKARKLRLTSDLAPDLPEMVRGDSDRLSQVLTNLISNAIKFTDTGTIAVTGKSTARENGVVVLRFEVKDTGMGVPPDAQALIFQSFAQADGSTTRRHGGTGLGLAISKQLVELMQGEIGVEGAPGGGSIFWFTVRLEVVSAAEMAR